MQKEPNVVVALTSEGPTSLDFWHEAVNFAVVHKLPIVFMIESNGYAESVPVSLKTAIEDLSSKAAGYGIPGAAHAAGRRADKKKLGAEIEVIDLRTLSPLDTDTFLESVAKTNRAAVVHEDNRNQ